MVFFTSIIIYIFLHEQSTRVHKTAACRNLAKVVLTNATKPRVSKYEQEQGFSQYFPVKLTNKYELQRLNEANTCSI